MFRAIFTIVFRFRHKFELERGTLTTIHECLWEWITL